MSYETHVKVARLIFLLSEKRLRQQFCPCRRPVADFIDPAIQKAMDDVEAALAED